MFNLRTFRTSVVPFVMSHLRDSSEVLSRGELEAQAAVMASLRPFEASACPRVIGMVGLIGSGKSTVARELAKRIGATIIEADRIRVELDLRGGRYELAQIIAESITLEIVGRGGSVIIDSDFVDRAKRASLILRMRNLAGRVVFVQAYCDQQLTISRINAAVYEEGGFYHRAARKRSSAERVVTPADVKLFELNRRVPHHCIWSAEGGGAWRPKKLDYVVASINTGATEAEQRSQLNGLGGLILARY